MEQVHLVERDERRSETRQNAKPSFELSVVVPCTERFEGLQSVYRDYAKELSKTGRTCEFVFVVDGPKQVALKQLREIKKESSEVTVVTLNREFGEATALAVGFDLAKAPLIVTLSAYHQVEPQDVHRILGQLSNKDCDLAVSWRHPRIDSVFNRWQSRVFHWAVRILTGTGYHDISCGLRAMKRKVAEEVRLYGDLHRFIPLLACERGFKVVEVPVRQSRLDVGRRVYRPGVYLRRLLDILTLFFLFKFTKKPLRFFGLVGTALSAIGAMITGYLGIYRLLGLGGLADRPLIILGVLLMVLGIQLFSIGLLGEIIIYTHAKDAHEYEVEKIEE